MKQSATFYDPREPRYSQKKSREWHLLSKNNSLKKLDLDSGGFCFVQICAVTRENLICAMRDIEEPSIQKIARSLKEQKSVGYFIDGRGVISFLDFTYFKTVLRIFRGSFNVSRDWDVPSLLNF